MSATVAAMAIYTTLAMSSSTHFWISIAQPNVCAGRRLLCGIDTMLAVISLPSWLPSWSPANPAAQSVVDSEHAQRDLQTSAPRNFALLADGAKVLYQMTTSTYGLSMWCQTQRWLTAGEAVCNHDFMLPTEVLRGGMPERGECWTFKGAEGHITFQLSKPINISHITMHNIPSNLLDLSDSATAPRKVAIWGLIPHDHFVTLSEPEEMFAETAKFLTSAILGLPSGIHVEDRFVRLTQFEYSQEAGLEGFPIIGTSSGLRRSGFTTVVLGVESNWGSAWTSIYRVGIHGTVMNV
ncbi:hypothetical protein B0H14DRAFT_3494235 [Mycena olivaceomarginata]|nr:hypothetical protein B0H14DRAFT_3494235 [Mycena olivaceomarginata]